MRRIGFFVWHFRILEALGLSTTKSGVTQIHTAQVTSEDLSIFLFALIVLTADNHRQPSENRNPLRNNLSLRPGGQVFSARCAAFS